MKKHLFVALIGVFQLSISPMLINAQTKTEAGVKISGEVTTPLTVNAADMQQFKRTSITRKDKDGNDHNY